MLQYVLLGILSYQSMTGYQVKSFMETSTAHFWYAKQSQLYSTLKKLEERGFLTSEIEEQQDRPDRRIYTITDEGRQELETWLAQPMTELEQTKDTLLLKLFFSARLEKGTILAQLRVQRALMEQYASSLRDDVKQEIEEAAAVQPHLARDSVLWELTRRYGEMVAETSLRWLDEAIATIEEQFDE